MSPLRPTYLRSTLSGLMALLSGSTCQVEPIQADPGPTADQHEAVGEQAAPSAPSPRLSAAPAVAAARTANQREQYEEALRVIDARITQLTTDSHPDEAAELRWLRAEALDALGRPDDARVERGLLAAGGHRLASWAALRLAEARLETAPAEALALVEHRTNTGWAGQDEASLIRAMATARLDAPQGEALLRAIVDGPATGRTRDRATDALATLLASADTPPRKLEAIRLLRSLATRVPPGRARDLDERVDAIRSELPEADRVSIPSLTLTERYARAERLDGAMQLRQAGVAFAAIADSADASAAMRCSARANAGRSFHRGRAHEEAIAAFDATLRECEGNEDRLANAMFFAARSQLRTSHAERAHSLYLQLASTYPSHSLADDSLLAAAKIDIAAGRREAAAANLDRAANANGDMRAEALFISAWDARRHGDHLAALSAFEASSATPAAPDGNDDLIGRASYWRARTLADLGRVNEARDAYVALAHAEPLRFYGQLSAMRVRGLDPALAQTLVPAFDRADMEPTAGALMHSEPFLNGLALLHVGATELADREFEAAHLMQGELESLAALAAAYEQNEVPHRACELARRRLGSGLDRALELPWLLRAAYPKAFEGLVEASAEEAHVPPSFVRSIAREESSFYPRALSPVHAHGLLQLMRGTAERLARPLHVSVRGSALFEPALNLRLGARYLGQLSERFHGTMPLVPASYNAGEGSVERWLDERGTLPVDEWIEEIPYPETRNYTRRVLQTWGIYSFLDEGALPVIDLQQPARH